MKRCEPPGFLSELLIDQLNYVHYSGMTHVMIHNISNKTILEVGTYLAPLQILHKLEHLFNQIIEIQFTDNCMAKTVIRRKKQFHAIVNKISTKNISGLICAPLETFTWAPEILNNS